MIYPTRRAVVAAAAGAPVALLLASVAPQMWLAGLAWALVVACLMLADALLAPSRRRIEVKVGRPPCLSVGAPTPLDIHVRYSGRAPKAVEVALEADERLGAPALPHAAGVHRRQADLRFRLTPTRRGEGRLRRVWIRWTGPLGLVWKHRGEAVDASLPVRADVEGVKAEAMRLFARDAQFGIKAQIDLGEGAEFHALREFQAGMDRRTVDWKQSARHNKLLAKEFRTERNHQVIMALDAGRVMCEPVAGAPRIDRAINAALLLAYVALRTGDRAGLFAFDSRPRANSGPMAGMGAFPLLQGLADRIDYSAEETNYTFALTTLSGSLQRRSLIVIFTDFADTTSAELMIENVGRLLRRHLVLFVVMRDEELEGLVDEEPHAPEDVSRAVVAGSLLREREVVLGRLRRLGVQIVDAPLRSIGPALLNAYLDLKRRDLL